MPRHGHHGGGGFFGGGGHHHHHGHGLGFGGPRRFHHHRGPGIGFVEGALAGAAIGAVAASSAAPRRTYYQRPPPERVVVVNQRAPPAPVVVTNAPVVQTTRQPFLVEYVGITTAERPNRGEDLFTIQVGAIDGASFSITRNFEQFNALQRSTHTITRRHLRASFPFKKTGLFQWQASVEEQRVALNMWLTEMVDKAKTLPGLQTPLYGFLDFHGKYNEAVQAALSATAAAPVAPVQATAVYDAQQVGQSASTAVPVMPAYPASQTNPPPAYSQAVAAETQRPVVGELSAANPFAPTISPANPFASGETKSDEWEVTPYFEEYKNMFNAYGPANGRLSPAAVKEALLTTEVAMEVLREIWELVDVDKDGSLDVEEFALAMYLCQQVKLGKQLERQLPPSLIPPSKR